MIENNIPRRVYLIHNFIRNLGFEIRWDTAKRDYLRHDRYWIKVKRPNRIFMLDNRKAETLCRKYIVLSRLKMFESNGYAPKTHEIHKLLLDSGIKVSWSTVKNDISQLSSYDPRFYDMNDIVSSFKFLDSRRKLFNLDLKYVYNI
jgi:hypothetical protein